MKTELVTTLKRRATEIISSLAEERDPILITQHGRPAAYLVDVETYEGLNQKLAVLESIARGERAIEEGRVVSHKQAREAAGAMAELIWTEPALSDLEAIAEYIALDKPDAAHRLVQRVFAHLEKLVEHPNLGSTIPELRPASRYRQIVEPPCRVFYRHERATKKIYVLAVLRGEKLFQKRLLGQRDKRT